MQKTSVFSDFYCLPNKLALMGLRPVFFGPCTPHGKPGRVGRAWGTRPGKRAALVAQGSSAHLSIASVASQPRFEIQVLGK
jgi:hypothetical protein